MYSNQTWNTEFQQLSELVLQKRRGRPCIATEDYEDPQDFFYSSNVNRPEEEIIKDMTESFTDWFSRFLILYSNDKVGCGFIRLIDEKQVRHKIMCITNENGKPKLEENYYWGRPCSLCNDLEICDDEFRGLCKTLKLDQ